jgi:hypothetical protein
LIEYELIEYPDAGGSGGPRRACPAPGHTSERDRIDEVARSLKLLWGE